MKISYNWLRQYIHTEKNAEQIAEILTATGLEVESIERIETIPGGLKGVVVGEVLECTKHPDADKLSLTKVNVGNAETLQIVCGAPNVAVGQKVLVATIGTKLHPTVGEPITIKKGKIRGQESQGMICAEDELGLGTSHAGIMVLESDAVIGMPAAEYLGIKEDYCLEIGLTPNRTDAFSHYGVARDLAAALRNMSGIENEDVKATLPQLPAIAEVQGTNPVSISIESEEGCARYAGLTIENVKVAPSPKWLQERLMAIGLRPVNNIVDITNFVQHETGQPLHAFDTSAIEGKRIVVRTATAGEKFVTLDGIERTLAATDLMICDAKKPICIAGVYGGLHSGVTDSTTSIFIESAWFNPVFVRKTSKQHGLKTDASFRFERGADINMCVYALRRAAALVMEVAGGFQHGVLTDIYPVVKSPQIVFLKWNSMSTLIGKTIDPRLIKSILKDLDITIESESDEGLQLSIPLYRSDVQREADVVEEVLRIYGYNNVEMPGIMKSSISNSTGFDTLKLENKVADMLSSNGFHEMMSMSLTKSKYAALPADELSGEPVEILNPLSADLAHMRYSMLHSGLEVLSLNQNHRNTDLRLYEFGHVYFKTSSGYSEKKVLSLFLTGRKLPESWNNTTQEVSFSDLRAAFEYVLGVAGIRQIEFGAIQSSRFADAMEYRSGKTRLATLGCVNELLLKAFDLKQKVWYAEINWENLLNAVPKERSKYREADKYPAVKRDLSLLLDKHIEYAEIEKIALETERRLLRSVNLFDVYEGKNLTEGKKSYAVSFILQDASKTMNDQQVETAMNRILKALQERTGAELRA